MISDSFLNTCFGIVFSKSDTILKNKNVFRDILEIISFFENKKTIEIPLIFKEKTNCLKKICELKLEGKEDDSIIDSIITSEKYKDFGDFLVSKKEENLSEDIILKNIEHISLRKKFSFLLGGYDELSYFLDAVKDGSFDSIDNLISDYEKVIKNHYCEVMEYKRIESVQGISTLDFKNDDWSFALKKIQEKYSRTNSIPTGYDVLDYDILNGGFEPSRLYIFAGGSGSGKSTLLLNFLYNASMRKQENEKDKKIFIYVTLENSIEESLLRIYMAKRNRTLVQALKDITTLDIKDDINSDLEHFNSNIIIYYFPPESISPMDLEIVINSMRDKYGKNSIKCLFVDYLDILKSDQQMDIFRLELSKITLGLKRLAVEYSIPVITGTQLSRSVYTVKDGSELNLSQMSESIKKVEHADFISLLVKDNDEEKNLVYMKIGKNRGGSSGSTLEFRTEFQFYKFINGYKVSNKDRKQEIDKGICNTDISNVLNQFETNIQTSQILNPEIKKF